MICFCKQKTAYEVRISDWSSDVCSSDLARFAGGRGYLLVSGTYDRDWGIRATDREWAIRTIGYDYDFDTGQNLFDTYYVKNSGGLTSGRQPTDSFPPNIFSDLSSFITGGVFWGKSSSRERFRSEEHTSVLLSLMRISYAVFCLEKKNKRYT